MGELIRREDNLSVIQTYNNEIIEAGQSLLFMVNELIEYTNSGRKSSGNDSDREK
jgi:hypothetical protein